VHLDVHRNILLLNQSTFRLSGVSFCIFRDYWHASRPVHGLLYRRYHYHQGKSYRLVQIVGYSRAENKLQSVIETVVEKCPLAELRWATKTTFEILSIRGHFKNSSKLFCFLKKHWREIQTFLRNKRIKIKMFTSSGKKKNSKFGTRNRSHGWKR